MRIKTMSNWSKNKQRKYRKFLARRRTTRNLCIVYGLYDLEGDLRYIGQTRLPLFDRMNWYRKTVGSRMQNGGFETLSPVHKWLLSKRFNVENREIDRKATWNVSEIIYIDRARRAGANLLNVLRGGLDTFNDLSISKGRGKAWRASKRNPVPEMTPFPNVEGK